MNNNVIYGINGPVVTVKDTDSFEMMEMVHVGKQNLVGEIIGITDKLTTIQVYEETTGLKPGDPVSGTGAPMNVLLGPGILDNIFDGIERPLKAIEEQSGAFISRGASVSSLDTEKLWNVTMKIKVGDKLGRSDLRHSSRNTDYRAPPYGASRPFGRCKESKARRRVQDF